MRHSLGKMTKTMNLIDNSIEELISIGSGNISIIKKIHSISVKETLWLAQFQFYKSRNQKQVLNETVFGAFYCILGVWYVIICKYFMNNVN